MVRVDSKAQIALFVLIGVILLVGLILALYLINQREARTTSVTTPAELYADNPALAAEVGRMQERMDDCLAEVTAELVEEIRSEPDPYDPILSEAELVAVLEEGVASDIYDCLYRFNTEGRLAALSDEAEATVLLNPTGLGVTVALPVEGTFQDETYRLDGFQAVIETDVRGLVSRAAPALAPLAAAVSASPGSENPFLVDGLIDLYALSEQGIYADLIVHPDGSCTVVANDYSGVLGGGDEPPNMVAQYVEECHLPEPVESDIAYEESYIHCAAGTASCAPVDLPPGFTILSPAITFDGYAYSTDGVAPGNYHALAMSDDMYTYLTIIVTAP